MRHSYILFFCSECGASAPKTHNGFARRIVHIRGCVEGGLPKNWTEVNSPKTREAKALQERFGCRKAQAAIATGEFLHKLEIPHFHNEPALVGIEKPVDFRLADWLLKGDAGEHFATSSRRT